MGGVLANIPLVTGIGQHMNGKDASRDVSPGRYVLRAVSVILALGAVYLALVSGQIGTAQRRGGELEKEVNNATVALNAQITVLRETPQAAPQVASEVRNISETLADLAGRAHEVNVSAMPTGRDVRQRYQDRLITYVSGIQGYAARLTTITAMVSERTETVRKMSDGFGELKKLSEPDATEKTVRTTLYSVKKEVDVAVSDLRSISTSTSSVYSSSGLIDRLSAISAVIGEVLDSMKDRDQARFSRAAESFSQLIKGDWQPLFLLYDTRGLGELAQEMRGMSQRRQAVVRAADRVGAVKQWTGLAALGLLVAALILGVFAWRPKPAR